MKQTATFVMLAILFGQGIQAHGQTPKPLSKAHDTFMMSYMNARSAYQEGLAKALLSVDRAEVFLLDFWLCSYYDYPSLSLNWPGDFIIVLQPVGERRRRVFRDFPARPFQPVLEFVIKMVNVVTEKRLFKLFAFAGIQFAQPLAGFGACVGLGVIADNSQIRPFPRRLGLRQGRGVLHRFVGGLLPP